MVDFTKNKTWAATEVIEDNADVSRAGKTSGADVSDYNAELAAGWFGSTTGTANEPAAGNFASMYLAGFSGVNGAQFALGSNVSRMLFRNRGSNVFGAWNEVFHSDNAASLPLTTAFAPTDDNTHSLGDASGRWSEVFAGNGAINTSDAREKTEILTFTFDEIEASKQLASEIGTYKFLASVDKKGDLARTHIGLTVQRAIEIMTANNLDPMSYGFICFDSWAEKVEAILDSEGEAVLDADDQPTYKVIKEAGDRYGFRYDQLNQFIIAGFNARLDAAGI